MSNLYDVIVVGSGINSLTCAALLAKKGNKVCVVERNNYLGGCIKTAELTLPGFRHDVMSGWHPLFTTSPAYAQLGKELAQYGLQYLNTHKPTGAITRSGEVAVQTTSRDENRELFDLLAKGDGDAYVEAMQAMERDAEFTFGLLGQELMSFATIKLLWKEWRRRGLQGLLDFFGDALCSSRDWLDQNFSSPALNALFSPWVLHTGLGPDATFSGAMNRVIAYSLEVAGMPVVRGGSENLVFAFQRYIESKGGRFLLNTHVDKIVVEKGVAKGVNIAESGSSKNPQVLMAKKAVVCNVTPDKLYLSLLPDSSVSGEVKKQAGHYKFGRAGMQIHLAIKGRIEWIDEALNDVAMVHVSDGSDTVAMAVAQADCGFLPAQPTIVVGQPTVVDPSRAPDGHSILWLQLQELPRELKGDSLNEIAIPADGQWNAAVREAYADRVIDQLAQFIPNLKHTILARSVLSPADLENLNINLVGGDPYSGHCGVQQFFMWRPFKANKNHDTGVARLFHIGASSHPGPGLGGNSGYLVANQIG